MESKLIKTWVEQGLRPSNFEFFTNRENLIIGKLPNKDAQVEYVCPKCAFYEMKTMQMGKGTTPTGKMRKKFDRPEFSCSKCQTVIKVPELKKA